MKIFARETPGVVVHPAAQVGVRYSIENPHSNVESNIVSPLALFKFAKAILVGDPIKVYSYGDMTGDSTYIEDLVEAIRMLTDTPPSAP